MRETVRHLRIWDRVQLSVLVGGICIAGALWGFVELAQLARDASPHAFDTQILLALRQTGQPDNPIGPVWLEESVRDVTALGSTVVLALVTLVTVIFLALVRSWRDALLVLVAVMGGQVLSSVLKLGIDRPRPDIVSHLAEVQTLSFPSGHAMLSAATYLTLGALLTRIVPGRATRVFALAVAVLLTLMVGASRVYLGVHWPSDVLAGWCAGFAWAMLCWLVARALDPQRQETLSKGDDAEPSARPLVPGHQPE